MSQITSEDRPLHQEVKTLIRAKLALQAELRNAPSNQKSFFVNIIRDLDQELSNKQDEQSQFVPEHPFDQFGLIITQFDGRPFTAELDGTVTIEIDHSNDEIRGPHDVDFTPETDTPTLRLQFDPPSIEVVELTQVETDPHETPAGTNITTVRRIVNEGRETGSFDGETGHIELPLDLFFDNSVNAPFVEEDAPANFDLSTKGIDVPVGTYEDIDLDGSPLDSETLEFKIVGESVFEDISGPLETSILGGRNVVLSAEGKLSNIDGPPLDVPSSVSFGHVAVGGLRTRSISIENNTGSNIVVSIPNSPAPPTGPGAPGLATFSWSPTGNRLLRRGDEMTILVTFTPGASGPAQTVLTITSNDSGSPHSITLRGTGVGGPGNGGGNGGDVHPK